MSESLEFGLRWSKTIRMSMTARHIHLRMPAFSCVLLRQILQMPKILAYGQKPFTTTWM